MSSFSIWIMCDYIFHNLILMIWPTCYLSPKSVLLHAKLPDSGDERMRLGAAITDSSHNNPGVFASGPLPQIQSVLLTPLGQNLNRFSSLLQEVGTDLYLGPGREVDLDTLMISRLAQSFRGMWTPGNLVKIFSVLCIWNSVSVCCCLFCCGIIGNIQGVRLNFVFCHLLGQNSGTW